MTLNMIPIDMIHDFLFFWTIEIVFWNPFFKYFFDKIVFSVFFCTILYFSQLSISLNVGDENTDLCNVKTNYRMGPYESITYLPKLQKKNQNNYKTLLLKNL